MKILPRYHQQSYQPRPLDRTTGMTFKCQDSDIASMLTLHDSFVLLASRGGISTNEIGM